MELSSFLLVHILGLVPPIVVLKETYSSARKLSDAVQIFFGLPELGRVGSIACAFVIIMIALDTYNHCVGGG